jgi:Flp pilus assembly protein TadG
MSRVTSTYTGCLSRLRADKRGNILVLTAAMLIPLLTFSGAAIDMARLYVVKVRLQQACDAGVLAGRKAMKDTAIGTALDTAAASQAQSFFQNNFQKGWFQNSGTVFTPTKAAIGNDSTVANAVSGVATTIIPMTVMSIFGVTPKTIAVSCQAVYDLADTDVMFVLDTTGSMSVTASSGSEGAAVVYTRADGTQAYLRQEQTDSKIDALRDAVILFDKTMTDNKQIDTIVRYGFAPYSTVVNIGKSLPTSTVTSNLRYNSRQLAGDYDYVTGVTSSYPVAQSECEISKRSPSVGYGKGDSYTAGSSTSPTTINYYAYVNFTGSVSWTSTNGGTCKGAATVRRPLWNYGLFTLDVASYLNQTPVTTPGRIDGSTSKWRGCIELTTVSNATSLTPGNLPSDLNPDVMPDWRPMWPEAVWSPQSGTSGTSGTSVKDESVNEAKSYKALSSFEASDSVTCPMEAQPLAIMTAQSVYDYVNATNFKAAGNTYHDYGMSWGLRMLSTKGPFSASVAPTLGRKQPTQNIVFMTDGTPVADSDNYQMYGIEGLDKRLTSGSNNEAAQHSSRLRVLCDAAKQRGITVYMIAFGTSLTSDMKYCSSPGQSFYAANSGDLQTAFAAIAKRIAMLRLNQ